MGKAVCILLLALIAISMVATTHVMAANAQYNPSITIPDGLKKPPGGLIKPPGPITKYGPGVLKKAQCLNKCSKCCGSTQACLNFCNHCCVKYPICPCNNN
ncbi:gibberellin-regulated protein 6-like [Impatiens glandulifera]|uniref:gibberellin-regulated protein 6-like n=1 Tax=Impatiens glandulifera TaxID=253017 RepID=UPI001FB0AE4B|nr:gibberellin-regulated protein 6-like [Impatiens glandulifera]